MKNNVTLKGCVVEKCIRISALFSAFRQVFGKDYYFGGETHDFWELVCVVEGAIGVTAGKDVFLLEAGQAVLHRPMEFHSFWSEKDSCPDIIVISGDLVDRHENRTDVDGAMEFIHALVTYAPVYFVSGNHEHQSGEWEILEEALVEAGVTVLNNGKSVIERNGDTITLLGLADKKANRHYDLLLHSLMAGQEDSFNILLSHRPELFETYVHEGLDLVFTGHAHGGQIVIPFFRQGIFAPHQGFFPKYTEGMHEKDGTVMIVSRGLGNSSFPFRIFNRPELIEVTLRQEGK